MHCVRSTQNLVLTGFERDGLPAMGLATRPKTARTMCSLEKEAVERVLSRCPAMETSKGCRSGGSSAEERQFTLVPMFLPSV